MEQQVDAEQARAVWRRLAAEIADGAIAEAEVEGALASIETLQQLVEHGPVALTELSVLGIGDIVVAEEGLVAVLRVEGEQAVVADHGVRTLEGRGSWRGVARMRGPEPR